MGVKAAIAVGVIGVILLVGLVALGAVIKSAVKTAIEDIRIIEENDEEWDTFLDTSADDADPLYIKYHMFNISNIEAVQLGAEPILQEVGPYFYRKIEYRIDTTFYNDGKELEYNTRSEYTFVPGESVGDSSADIVYTVNPGWLAVLEQAGSESAFPIVFSMMRLPDILAQVSAGLAAAGQDLSAASLVALTQTPATTLSDPNNFGLFLGMYGQHAAGSDQSAWASATYGLSQIQFETLGSALVTTVNSITQYLQALHSPILRDATSSLGGQPGGVGLFAGRSVHQWIFDFTDPLLGVHVSYQVNEETDAQARANFGMDTIQTGKDDVLKAFNLIKWNNETTVNAWDPNEDVDGFNSNLVEPFLDDQDKTQSIWAGDIGQRLDLKFKQETDLHGIPVWEYEIDEAEYTQKDQYAMPGRAMFNIAPLGAPLVLTLPHFYQCNEEDVGASYNWEGIAADESKHSMKFLIEPNSGFMLSARKVLQGNVFLSSALPLDAFNSLIPRGYYPIFWTEESGELKEEDADDVRRIPAALVLGLILQLVGGVVGGLMIIAAGLIFKKSTGSKPSPTHVTEVQPIAADQETPA